MKETIKNNLTKAIFRTEMWGQNHIFRLIAFNTILVLLVLLRSAGYFYPFFGISVNFIVFVLIVLSILILHSGSRSIFFLAFLFWVFAGILKILGLDVWAERTSIYTFEALVIGTILLIYESTKYKK